MKLISIITGFAFMLCLPFESLAQDIQGQITYNRKVDWIAIMSTLPHMTQEEIDRVNLTWGNDENDGRNYSYFFKDNKSVYTYKEEQSDGGYSWKKEKYVIIRDHKKKQIQDNIELLGKKYKVEEEIPKLKWKILNEIKEIEGYLCMKAETSDTIKQQTIHAWFTDAIPFYGGPEGYSGLPGMILELDVNDGNIIVSATEVDLTTPVEKLPIPKKIKGKEITYHEFKTKMRKYIDETIEGKKNPYWRVRL